MFREKEPPAFVFSCLKNYLKVIGSILIRKKIQSGILNLVSSVNTLNYKNKERKKERKKTTGKNQVSVKTESRTVSKYERK